jgi:23S rRNA pseudouridine1911/1915/1917 synthase
MAEKTFTVTPDDAGRRLDQFLVAQLAGISRARVQQLITRGEVRVNGAAAKRSLRIEAGDRVEVLAAAQATPLRAIAEAIPLQILYEDSDLAVVNKPAGMMVHAGAGATDYARNRGTLVNALLHHFRQLSGAGGELRPGIVHRLDRQTSGLMIVAKNDAAHQKLAEAFAARRVKKTYIALVHGWPKNESGTIAAAISRDRVRRTRMTTRARSGRQALSHYQVRKKFETPWGKFALVEIKIETGRTHQIRVHLASIGHPVAGDTLYGAPREIKPAKCDATGSRSLSRNFLHAARIEFEHPTSGKKMSFESELPAELAEFLQMLRKNA